MGNAYTIPVGANTAAEYLAYGDDSQFGDILAFAFLIVRRTNLARAEERLTNLKLHYRIPAETPLHCRILFNKIARKKSGIAHLTSHDARSIVARTVRIINRVPILLRYGRDSLSRLQNSLGQEIEFTNEFDGSKFRVPVMADPKGLLSLLMQGSFMVPPDGSGGPLASQCEIFVAEDATKVPFIGPRRQRADRMYAGFSDIGAPSGGVFKLEPTMLQSRYTPMLQLADVAAYMCGHAGSSDGFFREQLNNVRLWWRFGY